MKRGICKSRLVPGLCFRLQAAWTCRVSVFVFVLCLVIAPSSAQRHSMKIHLLFDPNLTHFASQDSAVMLKKSAYVVVSKVADMLEVSGISQPLAIKLDSEQKLCPSLQIPADLSGDGNVTADFALFIRANSCSSEDSGALSSVCSFNDRPSSGFISFCADTLAKKDPALLVAVTLRHLVSLLALDWRILARKRDRCLLKTASGSKCWYGSASSKPPKLLLTSKRVLRSLQLLSPNSLLTGLPLSADGRGWDSRLLFSSLLADSPITPALAPWLALDLITLALFRDLGWYSFRNAAFAGDSLVWGVGSGAQLASCATSCSLGLCNQTQDSPCFQLGPRANACFVCQRLARLVAFDGQPCLIKECSREKKTFAGSCFVKEHYVNFSCPGRAKCVSYEKACEPRNLTTMVSKLAEKVDAFQLPDVTSPPTPTISTTTPISPTKTMSTTKTISTTTSMSTTKTISPTTTTSRLGSHFALHFNNLDFDSIARHHMEEIKAQVKKKVSRLLGITDQEKLKITRIYKGSTIVDFVVFATTYSTKRIFFLLQQALHKNVLALNINGKNYIASKLESSDYEEPRSYLAEMIVGSTLGLVLIIGIASVVIVIIVKKVKRTPNSVYPSPEVPSDVDSVYARSNSLQTVSVASYAAIYELRRERTHSTRPTSLRNVVVSGPSFPSRVTDSGQL